MNIYAHAEKARMEEMIEFYEELYNLLNNQNSKIYEVYKEILETLKGIFQKNADILINGEEVKRGERCHLLLAICKCTRCCPRNSKNV